MNPDEPRRFPSGMEVIYRYPLTVTNYQTVTMPQGAKVLHVAPRDGTDDVELWALVDPDTPVHDRPFWIVPTGQAVPNVDRMRHVGTFQLHNGQLVFHVFEEV